MHVFFSKNVVQVFEDFLAQQKRAHSQKRADRGNMATLREDR